MVQTNFVPGPPPPHVTSGHFGPKAIWAKYSVHIWQVGWMSHSIWSDAETRDKGGGVYSHRSCPITASGSTKPSRCTAARPEKLILWAKIVCRDSCGIFHKTLGGKKRSSRESRVGSCKNLALMQCKQRQKIQPWTNPERTLPFKRERFSESFNQCPGSWRF